MRRIQKKRDTRHIARADEAHQPRGWGFRREAGLRRRVQRRDAGLEGGIPTQAMRPHMRMDAQYYAERGITGGVGMRRSAADAPVQRWTVPIPNAKRTAAKRGGARSGRPRRQSRDCREGRTQAPTPLFAPVVWLGRYWTQIRKHLISERRECDRVSFFNFPYLKPSDLLSYSLFVI